MKNISLSFVVMALTILSLPAFSQTESQAETDTTLLGLPGDNLDLFCRIGPLSKVTLHRGI